MPRPKLRGGRNCKIQRNDLCLGTGRHRLMHRLIRLKQSVIVKVYPSVQIGQCPCQIPDSRVHMICVIRHSQGGQRNRQRVILYLPLQIIPVRCCILVCFRLPGYLQSQRQSVNDPMTGTVTCKQGIIISAAGCPSDIRSISKIHFQRRIRTHGSILECVLHRL